MPLFRARDRLIYFVHVPRTGGSNLEDYLAARFGTLSMLDRDWMLAWTSGGWRSDSLLSSPQHLTAADAARLLPRETSLSFAVVRDPAARIVSEFRYQARSCRRYRRLTELGFGAWLRIMLEGARREPRLFDNHIRPQAEMVPDEAEVFRLEAGLGPLVAWLDAIAGKTAPELHIRSDEPKSSRRAVALSRDDLRLIRRFYAADYARFDYPDPDLAASRPDRLVAARAALARAAAPWVNRFYFRGRL